MPNPSRNEIYDAVIRRMVGQALQEQEERFAQEHGEDTEEQLAMYLRQCAEELGHTPWPREIIGGNMLKARFGSWENAVEAARLPPPNTPDRLSEFARIREETERQKLLYREKKRAKKAYNQRRMKAQKEKQKRST